MTKPISPSTDLRGLSRITIAAIVGVTELAENVHMNILHSTARFGLPLHRPLSGPTSLVYRSIRGVTHLVGSSIDTLLGRLTPLLGERSAWPGREAVLSALNGVLGDYLARSGNPLAIAMQFRRNGLPLVLESKALAAAIPQAGGKILVLAHGLCMNDLEWNRRGHDHGAALAAERGYTPVYLHYNSGLHISENGKLLDQQLEQLVQAWPVPVEELTILCHSMGGLITRSACHQAHQAHHAHQPQSVGRAWPETLRKLVFLGTPHHGAPLERGGNWFHVIAGISTYTEPFSILGKIRSAGITDLRHGTLLESDWQGKDRFEHHEDPRHPVPLPPGVSCHAIAATTGKKEGDLSDAVLGDGLVPLDSALGKHPDQRLDLSFAPANQWIAYETNHLDVLDRREVYDKLLEWL